MVYTVYLQKNDVQDVVKLSENFEGNMPNIDIKELDRRYFSYKCRDTAQILHSPCAGRTPLSDKCFVGNSHFSVSIS